MGLWTLTDRDGDQWWRCGSSRDRLGRLTVEYAEFKGGVVVARSEEVVLSGDQTVADRLMADWLSQWLPGVERDE